MIFVHPLWSIILLNYLTSYCYSVVSVICKGFELYRIPPCGRFWERLVFGSSSHEYLITDVNETERRISRQLLDWSKREKLTSARRETRLSRGFCATTRGWIGGRRWGIYGNLWSLSWASGSYCLASETHVMQMRIWDVSWIHHCLSGCVRFVLET